MTLSPGVPIFSKKQQNKTLSAKKKPQKTVRNILASKNSSFWPVLEDITPLVTELEFLKFEKSIKKKDVSKATDLSAMEVDAEDGNEIRKLILFGVNEVNRCLKNNTCSALLFDADVPRILVQHLLYMASLQQVPITGVRGLTSIILNIFGFKSSTICFKTEPSNRFYKIVDLIKFSPADCTPATSEPEPIDVTMVDQVKDITLLQASKTNAGVIYLYRKSKKERAFVPPDIEKALIEPPVCEQKNTDNFIKIEGPKNVIKKNSAIFKPLLVNKVQNNVNRPKKKNAK